MSGLAHPPHQPPRYATLDGLRGAAALMVALFHLQVSLGAEPVRGYLAVDLFFGISGFVLAAAYVERFRNGLDSLAFLSLRAMRFYPLYLCGFPLGLIALAAGTLPDALGPRDMASASLFGLLMFPNPTSYQLFPLNGPAWSLLFELVINFALACWLWKRRSVELAILAAAALIVLLLLTGAPWFLNMGWNWTNLYGGAARTTFSFVVGMLLYRAVGARTPRPHAAAALIPMTVLCFAVMPAAHVAIGDLVFAILACPLILLAATTTEAPPWARPAMHWLGAMSYALYAIHWPLARLMAPLLSHLPVAIAAAIYLGTAMLFASLLEKHVDRPLQKYFKRRLNEQGRLTRSKDAVAADARV